MREQTPETVTEFYTVIKLGESKNSYRVDHAPRPAQNFRDTDVDPRSVCGS